MERDYLKSNIDTDLLFEGSNEFIGLKESCQHIKPTPIDNNVKQIEDKQLNKLIDDTVKLNLKLINFGFNQNELLQPSYGNQNIINGFINQSFIFNIMLYPIRMETNYNKKNILFVGIKDPIKYNNTTINLYSSIGFKVQKYIVHKLKVNGIYGIEYYIERDKNHKGVDLRLLLQVFTSCGQYLDTIESPIILYQHSSNNLNNPNGNFLIKHQIKKYLNELNLEVSIVIICNYIKEGKQTDKGNGQQLIVSFNKLDHLPMNFQVPQFKNDSTNITFRHNVISNIIQFNIKIQKGIYNIALYYNSQKGKNNITEQIRNYIIK